MHPDRGMGLGARPADGDVCGRGDPDRRSLRDLHHPAEMGHAGSGRGRHVMIIPSIALSGTRSRCFFINRKPDLSRPSRRRSYTSPVARHPEHAHGCERRGPGPRSTGMGMALLQRNRHMPIVPPMIMAGLRTAVVHDRIAAMPLYRRRRMEEYNSRGISTFMGLSQTNGTKVGIAVFYSHPSNRGPVQ